MKALIAQAMDERRQIQAILDGRQRITLEPYALGLTQAGEDALLCRQVAPPLPPGADWRLYHLSELRSLQVLGERFIFRQGARHLLLGRLAEITDMV